MKRFIKKDAGFTLIELLVVIVILAILMAVAAPSFLGQTKKAQNSAALQKLTVAYKAAKASTVPDSLGTSYDGNYGTAASVATAIENSEPELTAVAGTAFGSDINVEVTGGGTGVTLRVASASSACTLTAGNTTGVSQSCA